MRCSVGLSMLLRKFDVDILIISFFLQGYVTKKFYLPVTHLQFHRSASRSYFNVGPLECFGAPRNKSKVTRERQREASRFIYSLCHIVNLATPEPHSSAATLNYTQMRAGPTTRRSTDVSSLGLSTTGQQTNEVPTHKSTVISSGSPSNNSEGSSDEDAYTGVGQVIAYIVVTALFLFSVMVVGYILKVMYTI